jgi:hypothetical protein
MWLMVWRGAVVGRLMAWCAGWISRFVAEIEVAASAAVRFGLGKIGGITMDIWCHAAGFVADDGVGVGCHVVEEFDNGSGGVIGGVGLGSGDGAESNDRWVNGNAVVQERTDDLLEAGHLGFVERRA